MDVALMLQLDCQPVNSGSTLICPQNWVFQHDANPNFIENQTRGCCMTLFFVHISRELCCENTTKFVRVAVNQFYSFILEIFHFCRKIFCTSQQVLPLTLAHLASLSFPETPDSLHFLARCLWILKSEQGKQKAEARAESLQLVAFLENGIQGKKRGLLQLITGQEWLISIF